MNDELPSQRNWFPVIVAGLTIVLAIAFYAKFRPGDFAALVQGGGDDQPATTSVVTEDGYRTAVAAIFAAYDNNQNPTEAYNALIALHVPASMQQFHIDCIIALGKLMDGNSTNTDDAMARFNALHAQYSWFTL
ncbi:MAG: hypothetical protein AAB473_01905 [Patescibacteria group bacterium]